MGRAKLILGIAVLVLAVIAVWQVAACELASIEFHEELHDLAAQAGARIGLVSFSTDQELRDAVVQRAKTHGIQLEPEQVTVERTGAGPTQTVYLATNYKMSVALPGFSFTLHFHASSAK